MLHTRIIYSQSNLQFQAQILCVSCITLDNTGKHKEDLRRNSTVDPAVRRFADPAAACRRCLRSLDLADYQHSNQHSIRMRTDIYIYIFFVFNIYIYILIDLDNICKMFIYIDISMRVHCLAIQQQ